MSVLASLKQASSLEDVAAILGYQPKGISFILYKIPTEQKYKTFEVSKKSGGVREIKAPMPQLKKLQKHLANALYACRSEIERERSMSPVSHGFRKDLSIITNARVHKRSRYVLNLDLENFFPTLNFGRVRGFFMKDHAFLLNEKIATVLAQIACDGHALPQGSPCSPIISDLIAQALDMRMVRHAKRHRVTYSRYADDLTFSTNQKIFPTAVAMLDPDDPSNWRLSEELVSRIATAGFVINNNKTRMHIRGSRQLVTGLVVNEKVNIRSDYYRSARAMCRSLFTAGAYFRSFIPPLVEGEEPVPDWTSSLNPVEGVLSHIYHVKKSEDRRDAALQRSAPSATRKLYRLFLFYKYFMVPKVPLIICEGKTDNIYLKEAIKRLPAFHPRLGVWDECRFRHATSLFSYENQAHELLSFGGGTGDLKFLISQYLGTRKYIKHRPMPAPVIMVIDNDEGAKDIFSAIKKITKKTIDLRSAELFYHIIDNLYLVKTPEMGPDAMSCMEDLFKPELLSVELEGKKFNRHKDHGAEGEYGKAVFAEAVVRANSASIDFSGFSPLLERIVAAADAYIPRPANVT